jgi:hypothetical protein
MRSVSRPRFVFALAPLASCLASCLLHFEEVPRARPSHPSPARHSVWGPPRVEVDGTPVPFAFIRGSPFVDVRINGRGPYRFVVDTGSWQTFVDPALVEELGLPAERGAARFRDFSGGYITTDVVRMDLLDLGGTRFEGVWAESYRVPGLAQPNAMHAWGILGLSVFRSLTLVLDYPNRSMSLLKDPLQEPDGRRVFPLQLNEAGMIAVEMELGKVKRPFGIDSGAWSCFAVDSATASELQLQTRLQYGFRAQTTGGVILEEGIARLKGDVVLGAYSFHSPVVNTFYTNLIGGECLRHFAVLLDLKNGRVSFERASYSPIQTPPVTTYFAEVDPWGSRPVVRDVGRISPTEALLRKGDVVLGVDGQSAEGLGDIFDLWQGRVEPLHLTVEREGDVLAVDVPGTVYPQ